MSNVKRNTAKFTKITLLLFKYTVAMQSRRADHANIGLEDDWIVSFYVACGFSGAESRFEMLFSQSD